MTAIIGAEGGITMPSGSNAVLRSWQATVANVVSEVTEFTEAFNRTFAAGLVTLSGSAVGSPDDTAAPGAGAPPVEGVIQLLADTITHSWSATVVISSVAIGIDKAGDASISFDFINGDADDFVEAWV